MSLLLPPSDSPIRDLFDMAHLAEIASPENRSKIPTLYDASLRLFNTPKDVGFQSANVFAVSSGCLCLVNIDRDGISRILWTFGDL